MNLQQPLLSEHGNLVTSKKAVAGPGKPHPATGGETYFSSAPLSAVMFVPFAFAASAIGFGDTISPLAFR